MIDGNVDTIVRLGTLGQLTKNVSGGQGVEISLSITALLFTIKKYND